MKQFLQKHFQLVNVLTVNRAAFLRSFFHQVGKAEEMYSHPLGKQEVLTAVSLLTGKIGSLPDTPKLLLDAAKL